LGDWLLMQDDAKLAQIEDALKEYR